MKPHQLLYALMSRAQIGSNALAVAIGQPGLQGQIHRWMHGLVAHPRATTAQPIAAYFSVPMEALYVEEVATKIAKERGLTVVEPKRRRKESDSATEAKQAKAIAERYLGMSADERKRFELLLEVATGKRQPVQTDLPLAPTWDGKERRKRATKTAYKRRAADVPRRALAAH